MFFQKTAIFAEHETISEHLNKRRSPIPCRSGEKPVKRPPDRFFYLFAAVKTFAHICIKNYLCYINQQIFTDKSMQKMPLHKTGIFTEGHHKKTTNKVVMTAKDRKFEDILDELEKLINEVENDVLPLEKMVDRVTHGAKLIRQCREKLNVMNSKVELMFKDDGEQGEFTAFDPASERAQATASEHKINKKTATCSGDIQEDLPF